MNEELFKDGEFFVGCNYWASHAGTNMWHDWQPEVIDKDFELLAKAKVKVVRAFPLWSDFQPIKMHYAGAGACKEIRIGEDILPFTPEGKAGISPVMLERFCEFLDIAKKHDIKLVIGLVTGWMSGRLHVPEFLEGKNLLCDPVAMKWEIKFVKHMVKTFKNHSSIVAWDLGNECNCLSPTQSSEEGYLWASVITMAIKSEDNERPVISGMHGTFPELTFRPQDLGEILDVLCTHPYPLFVNHCNTDPIVEQKSVMHSVAETLMYRGLSKKPAFVEEIGNHCPMLASDENAADYINTVLNLLWAHNCLGLMWWCGFEQKHLTHTPYDWDAGERELGLFYGDYQPKPVVKAMTRFADFTEIFKYKKLPHRIVDAVCIINAQGDTWKSTYGTFILAKQAGLDVEFCYMTDEIPQAKAYILPSVEHMQIPDHVMKEILSRVENGAILYLSIGNGLISPFDFSGLKAMCRYKAIKDDTITLNGEKFTYRPDFKIDFETCQAKVLATDGNNRPIMSENKYGKGVVYTLACPIEDIVATTPGIVSGEGFVPYYKFYKSMDKLRSTEKMVINDNPFVAYTEHIVDENTRIVVAVNCVPRQQEVNFVFDGFSYSENLSDSQTEVIKNNDGIDLIIKGNSAFIFEIRRK